MLNAAAALSKNKLPSKNVEGFEPRFQSKSWKGYKPNVYSEPAFC